MFDRWGLWRAGAAVVLAFIVSFMVMSSANAQPVCAPKDAFDQSFLKNFPEEQVEVTLINQQGVVFQVWLDETGDTWTVTRTYKLLTPAGETFVTCIMGTADAGWTKHDRVERKLQEDKS